MLLPLLGTTRLAGAVAAPLLVGQAQAAPLSTRFGFTHTAALLAAHTLTAEATT